MPCILCLRFLEESWRFPHPGPGSHPGGVRHSSASVLGTLGVVCACCVWWPGLLGQDAPFALFLPWLERGAGPAVVQLDLWVLGLVLRGVGLFPGIVPSEKESTSGPLAGV